MRVPSRLITRILLSFSIMYHVFVSVSAFDDRLTEFTPNGNMLTIIDDNNYNYYNSTAKEETVFVSTICTIIPNVCSKMRQIKERFLINTSEFQARGPKDLIAIISTMLASLLGAILVKLNVLIVLSLISVGIGKLLLLILVLKTKIFSGDHSHQHHQPVVYEKVYYPRHDYNHITPQEEYPSEMYEHHPSNAYS